MLVRVWAPQRANSIFDDGAGSVGIPGIAFNGGGDDPDTGRVYTEVDLTADQIETVEALYYGPDRAAYVCRCGEWGTEITILEE